MARRIDIELTSRRPDGSWTWRAPGARQPRGDVDGTLLPEDAKVGDVLRADAEFDLDGILVTSVVAPRAPARSQSGHRIEILGPERRPDAGVSVILAPGSRRRSSEEGERRGRRRPDTEGAQEGRRRPRRDTAGGDGEGAERPRAERPRAERGGRGERPGRSAPRPAAEGGERQGRPGRPTRPGPAGRPERAERGERPRRLQPAATYRNAALAELRPEQLPVAEQLLRGGIPALRAAIDEQNARAKAEGRSPVSAEPLLAMAEELLPKINLATWKDRATAVRGAANDAPLGEVRAVVAAASTVALDDEGRALHVALQESLESRVTALRQSWLSRVATALAEGRVADALRVASRPPEPAARIPADVAVAMAGAAGAALNPEVPEEQWLALLEAVVSSPVRRTVKPAGLPAQPSEELLQAARRNAGQVPELARLLGLPIPPPPGPRRPAALSARRG